MEINYSDSGVLMDLHLELTDDTESPVAFHRWSLLSAVGAILERKLYLESGAGTIFPNMYTVLLGGAGCRKSTAINMSRDMIEEAGYTKFSRDRTSPEKFIQDLRLNFGDGKGTDMFDALGMDLGEAIAGAGEMYEKLANVDPSQCSDMYICASELQDFIGSGNMEFISLLTNLWDNLRTYNHGLKTSNDEVVIRPTLSMIGGATPTTFQKTFPPEAIGTGMLSRMILVHGEQRKRIAFPRPLDADTREHILSMVRAISTEKHMTGAMVLEDAAKQYLEEVYIDAKPMSDTRFAAYDSRRFTHLLKLAMNIAAMNLRMRISLDDAILANTILSYTEAYMPKALGEFGIEGNTALNNQILEILTPVGLDGKSLKELRSSLQAIETDVMKINKALLTLMNLDKIDKRKEGAEIRYYVIPKVLQKKTKFTDFTMLKEYCENPKALTT